MGDSKIGQLVAGNEFLKDLPRMIGSEGNDDYFQIAEVGNLLIGLKCIIEGYEGVLIYRIRFANKEGTIGNVESLFHKDFSDQYAKYKNELHDSKCMKVSKGHKRVSFLYYSGSMAKIADLLGEDYKEFTEAYDAYFKQLLRALEKTLNILLTDNTEAISKAVKVVNELKELYRPDNPNALPEDSPKAKVIPLGEKASEQSGEPEPEDCPK